MWKTLKTALLAFIAALVVVLMIGVALAFYARSQLQGAFLFEGFHTSDTTPVVYELGGTKFRLPRNYLSGSGSIKKKQGPVDSFMLEFILPDLKPYSAQTKAKFDELGWGDKIWIYVEEIGPMPTAATSFERTKGPYTQAPMPADAPPGFTSHWPANSKSWEYERFVKESLGEIRVFAHCIASPKVPSPSCQVLTDFSDTITYTVTYHRKHLAQWQEIDAKVRARLAELIIKE